MSKLNNIVLIGFKASGKSTIGRWLAGRLQLQFIDLDTEIEALFEGKESRREIYCRVGLKGWIELEKRVLTNLQGKKDLLLATGGGTPMNDSNCQLLRQVGIVFHLKADYALVSQRILEEGLPPFAASLEVLEQLYDERTNYYERIADETVDVTKWPEIALENVFASRLGENLMVQP